MANEKEEYHAVISGLTPKSIIKPEIVLPDPRIEIVAPEEFDPDGGIIKVKLENLKSQVYWGPEKRKKGYNKCSISGQRILKPPEKPPGFRIVQQSQSSYSLEKLINIINDEKVMREFNRVFLDASEKMHTALIKAAQGIQDPKSLG